MSTPLPKFILDPQAYLEIRDAYRWYENVRQGLGEEFLAYLDGYFKTLQRGNVLFPVKRYPAYRELPLKRFPFVIIYEQTTFEIYVFSVFNTDQDPAKKPLG